MALSQLQCLDEGNINYRTNESKPEFYYSEAQRVAVETLLAHGAQAFNETVTKENLREFLSELDIEHILSSVRDFLPEKPGTGPDEEGQDEGGGESEGHSEGETGGEGEKGGEGETGGEGEKAIEDSEKKPLSLHYWPDTSDISWPSLDLGWPDSAAYRGVTRANVYTQPPVEGSIHIKEMIRRMINQAQKVIAVVMDLFTDIDIFKDLLDASVKRKIPVYIIHDEANIKYFLKMCECSGMHMGMLKNLRVFSIGGTEFNTRSAKTIVGRQMQKFLLVDGDRAASGSYSFTWTASRLDRNIITVLSGQAVETFDKEFRELLIFSKAVNLHKLNLTPEQAEPVPVQQTSVLTAEQSAAIARKLINPKYALVRANNINTDSESSEKKLDSNSDGKKQPNDPNKAQKVAAAFDERLAIHPALLNMPKVDMFLYLPTFVEIPQSESQQQDGILNMKERNRGPCQSDRADSSNRAVAQQGEATCKKPNVIPTETLTAKEDLFQNHPQRDVSNRDTENEPRVDLSTTNRIKTREAKQKPNANVRKRNTKLTKATAVISTQHKDKWVTQTTHNSTKAVERLQMDSPSCRVHVEQQVADSLERDESGGKEVLTVAMGETEAATESNDAKPDQDTPPEEADLICREEDCPSNPSTNYTPDWNTYNSSLHEPSIASSDSDDFYDYDYVDSTIKRTASGLMVNYTDDDLTIGKVNNIVSRGTFVSPWNNSKELSHSMNNVNNGNGTGSKDVNTFFRERAALRRKGLDKLKLTLEINYLDKFQRNRYAFPPNSATNTFESTTNIRSFQPLHGVSRNPDMNKSRRLMFKPMGVPCSRTLQKNYPKIMPCLSVAKFHEQKGFGNMNSAAGLGIAESKPDSNCAPQGGISSDPNMSSSSTTTPLGLSLSKLAIYKNLKVKMPANRVAQCIESTQKALSK